MGYPLISDDILSIEFNEKGVPIVFPGFPRIKMCFDSIKYLNEDSEEYEKIYPKAGKCSYSINGEFITDPQPLKSIYVLKRSSKSYITEFKRQNSLIELVKNSYCLKYLSRWRKIFKFNTMLEYYRKSSY